MQTFLPYANWQQCAEALDYRRLGKQRVEAWQILRCLLGESSGGWAAHPAVAMWAGSEGALAEYGKAMCDEWIERGYRDTMRPRFDTMISKYGLRAVPRPSWIGDPRVHLSHRANLIRKDSAHYGPQFGNVSPDLPYVWPV